MDMLHLPPGRHLLLLCVAGATMAAGSVVVLGERGVFAPLLGGTVPATLRGMTVEDDAAEVAMPVVTSLRSGGEAERRGVRVGDRIDAIDGRPVRDLAELRRVIAHRARGPVALHIRRGDAIWTVAIDRAESAARTEPHDPQDPAG